MESAEELVVVLVVESVVVLAEESAEESVVVLAEESAVVLAEVWALVVVLAEV